MQIDRQEELIISLRMAEILRRINLHFVDSEVMTQTKFNEIQEQALANVHTFVQHKQDVRNIIEDALGAYKEDEHDEH